MFNNSFYGGVKRDTSRSADAGKSVGAGDFLAFEEPGSVGNKYTPDLKWDCI
jgi:hypothetical protein